MIHDIYQEIKDRILFLEYVPGHILNENSLAKEFGVSRTPLRQILNRLEWEQLVRTVPRTGTLVTEIELHKMMNVYRIRLETERLEGILAAENIMSDELEMLTCLAEECRELSNNSRNYKQLASVSFRFRDILRDATNNLVLKQILEYLFNLTHRAWYIVFSKGDWTEEVTLLSDEIEQTYKALASRDPKKAGQVREDFLSKFLERIKNKF